MNYIKQLNAFWRWRRQHTLPASAQALWYSLTAEQNAEWWQEELCLPSALLRHWLGDVGPEAFRRARDSLVSEELLTVHPGKGGTPVYCLAQLYEEDEEEGEGDPATSAETGTPDAESRAKQQQDTALPKQRPKSKPKPKPKTTNVNHKQQKPVSPVHAGGEADHAGTHHGGHAARQTGRNPAAHARPAGRARPGTDWNAEAERGW